MKYLKLFEDYDYDDFVDSGNNRYVMFIILGTIYGDYEDGFDPSNYDMENLLRSKEEIQALHTMGVLVGDDGNPIIDFNDESNNHMFTYISADRKKDLILTLEAWDLKGWSWGEWEHLWYIKDPEYKIMMSFSDLLNLKKTGYSGKIYLLYNGGVDGAFDNSSIWDCIKTDEDIKNIIKYDKCDCYGSPISDDGIDSLTHLSFENIDDVLIYNDILNDDDTGYDDDFYYYIYDTQTMQRLESGTHNDNKWVSIN